jgi:hypothetical protein
VHILDAAYAGFWPSHTLNFVSYDFWLFSLVQINPDIDSYWNLSPDGVFDFQKTAGKIFFHFIQGSEMKLQAS